MLATFRPINSSFTADFCQVFVAKNPDSGFYRVYLKKKDSTSNFELRFAEESDVVNYLTLFYSGEEGMRGFVYILPEIHDLLDTYEEYENLLDDNNLILSVVEFKNEKNPLNYAGILQILNRTTLGDKQW